MVGIVTVLYNSASVLPDFFRSLDEQTYRDFTLHIVDNASPDNSLELARKLSVTVSFPTVFIENQQNSGIAQGNNLGIRAARKNGCNWILLSNNDTVWQPNTLAMLLNEAETTDYQIIVPKILYPDGRIWYAGGRRNRLRGGTTHFKHERILTPRPVKYAPSCCMLIHSTIFDRIGTMDERFFLYYDDTDFVRRAANECIDVLYLPQAVIKHKESSSVGAVSPITQYWLSRNLLFFTQLHHSIYNWYYILLVNMALLFTKRLLTFQCSEWWASWCGTRDGIRLFRKNRLKINALNI
jgi:GT2 family glycosyltransferase